MISPELLFQEFIDALQTVDDEEGFGHIASRVTHGLGFKRFAYLNLTGGTPF